MFILLYFEQTALSLTPCRQLVSLDWSKSLDRLCEMNNDFDFDNTTDRCRCDYRTLLVKLKCITVNVVIVILTIN